MPGDAVTGARPAASARREYALVLALGVAGAGSVLLSVRQGWARVVTAAARPLPAATVSVRGQDLVPLAGALGLAALAGLAAVLATRGLTRRLVGVLLAAFGVGAAVAVSMHLGTAAVLAAASAAGRTNSPAGSVTGGSAPGLAGAGGAAPGVAGVSLAGHVTMAAFPWRWAVLLGALAVIAAGLLVAWRGATWPVMSSRYDQPAAQRPHPADTASLWDSLSQGVDPTDAGPGNNDHDTVARSPAREAASPADRPGPGSAGRPH
ncbi:MAG TPA: Trp biosynthesis-associated membrane protein [Streptosporangiaceae bacterium]